MRDTLTVSMLDESDVDSVKALETESGMNVWSRQDYLKLFGEHDAVCLKAEKTTAKLTQTVGFVVSKLMVGAETDEDLGAEGSAEIYNISVARSFRNTGIGGELLRKFFEICRTHKIKKFGLRLENLTKMPLHFIGVKDLKYPTREKITTRNQRKTPRLCG